MGKSDSIEKKMAGDQKFREFMDGLQNESQTREDQIQVKIDELVKKHYEGNGWDYARFFGNKQSDYQNYDDWSLDRVNAVIDAIGNALQGGDFPSSKLPGSDEADKSTIDEAKEFLGSFTADYTLIIARVRALISGVLSQFSVASEATQKSSLNDMFLSGGMHLFFGSSGSVYTNNTFFSNQFIGSFQIVFEVYMSVDEARAIGLQQILATTAQELTILNQMIIDIRKAQADSLTKILKSKPEDYVSTKLAYDLALASVKEDRAALLEEYNSYKQVTDAVDALFDQLDLSSFGVAGGGLALRDLFNERELSIAKRYINERTVITQ
ncbi:MAG TPA: hypothetical protein VN040_04690 [Pseudosphingobacterium sp.]|nr:hypothetical protein [Pseudosphingobacterium sp.]